MLNNGNFVIKSSVWNNFRGAATFGNGITGTSGVVGESNSLIGSNQGDRVGQYARKLTNNNYVVRSPSWNSKGAVTWGSGQTGVSGIVSIANSFVGDSGGGVGFYDVVALTNGNYVINSAWATRGGVTWANATTGITGTVSENNSLIGDLSNGVGNGGVYALPNGNYVIASWTWGNVNGRVGAVTLCDGTIGKTGFVTEQNSLIGSVDGDWIGDGGIAVLPNSNFVVQSRRWNGGRGAVIFVNSSTGLIGTVSEANSLVGNSISDSVGYVTVLNNGNYLVRSSWSNGSMNLWRSISVFQPI